MTEVTNSKKMRQERLTFLAAPPGVSLQTRADVVPHAQTAVLTGRTAHSWRTRVSH